uniref:Protein Gawky n=1 Tax=Aceria tosichella TaxID=561515 RepID=A0A6G1S5M6_9ACAR
MDETLSKEDTPTRHNIDTDSTKTTDKSIPEDLLSNKRWGTTPIRQDTPWELPPTSQATTSTQPGGGFARAPGPASSILDANAMTPKPFGMTQRASTWSSFGTPPSSNDGESGWPKSTAAGISTGGNSMQPPPSNAFDLVHEFEPGKSWHGSNLMKSLDDDSPITIGPPSMSSAFPGAYGLLSASRSPTGSQFESSGIGTWSPIVKGGRSGSMWDGDGQEGGRGEGGRFDDGTAIWGNPVQTKAVGIDWDKTGGDGGASNDKSRPSNMAGNNQSTYRPQQSSSSSSSLLMSSNTSPSSQQNRNQQHISNKPSTISHNFDQVQQQSNALSSQANQPNRGIGLSSNVPPKHQHQLTTMVQQIQLAVQAGHLNPQILNQPLAPVTLQLLYQLLQQIRSLHQLQMKFNQPGSHQAAYSVQMTKTKQNILNLQNQIAAQQAMHMKQTQTHNISSRQPSMPNIATGGMGGNLGPALPPGISQSGDSFRSGNSVGDFHGQALVNNFGADSMTANGLATSLSHMTLGGAGMVHSSRFDQPWRAPANKQHQSTMGPSAFANHNLMNAAPGGMQKSMLNPSSGNGGSSYIGMQQGGEFARAPGPASSMMDNNMTSKPFGMTNRSASTWSAFGNSSSNDSEPEWPKSTTSSGISSGNTTQPSNAFDLVPEFEPGKPWRGSMLMRSVEDDPTMTPGSMARSLAPQRKTIWSDEIL